MGSMNYFNQLNMICGSSIGLLYMYIDCLILMDKSYIELAEVHAKDLPATEVVFGWR